jgi:hypothetical protein
VVKVVPQADTRVPGRVFLPKVTKHVTPRKLLPNIFSKEGKSKRLIFD